MLREVCQAQWIAEEKMVTVPKISVSDTFLSERPGATGPQQG